MSERRRGAGHCRAIRSHDLDRRAAVLGGHFEFPGCSRRRGGTQDDERVAGGLALGAAGDRTHVIGPDGFVIGAHRRFWFDPAVAPGSTIVVPQTPAPEPATVTEGDRWNHPWLGWAIALVAGLGLGVGL